MDLIVNWSDRAIKDLEDIFDYYKTEASLSVARKLTKAIVTATLNLKYSPRIGVKEPLFENSDDEFRYLVKGNYKILYCIENNIVFIVRVFDARQNPIKMIK